MFDFLKKYKIRILKRVDIEKMRQAPSPPNDEQSRKAAENLLLDLGFQKIEPKGKSLKQVIEEWQEQVRSDKPQIPVVPVPIYDYELLKRIRKAWAVGEWTFCDSIEQSYKEEKAINHIHHQNAAILNKHYGISEEEIFQLTGCVIDPEIKNNI